MVNDIDDAYYGPARELHQDGEMSYRIESPDQIFGSIRTFMPSIPSLSIGRA
jgi:hypothetical protein